MDSKIFELFETLHQFLYDNVYYNQTCKGEENKVVGIIQGLYDYYNRNPSKLPDEYKLIAETDGVSRAITDHIAGMTDRYAVQMYSEIYVPRSWNI